MKLPKYFFAVLVFVLLFISVAYAAPQQQLEGEFTITLLLASPEDRWNFLLDAAKAKFEVDNPGATVNIDAQIIPFGDRFTALQSACVAGQPIDIVSLDQPEVGFFAAGGCTTDLTDRINADLDGLSDWLPAHRSATLFEGRQHAIWAWTDARVLWYWRDLVEEAGVNPETDMLTWEGYIASCQQLNDTLADQNVEGCLQIGQPWIADWTLPYVWMQNGDLGFDVNPDVAAQAGADEAWVPAFDSDAWVGALEFTREQIDAGIEPFTEHQFGPAFQDRRFATWLGGTWVYGGVSEADAGNLGLVAAFPVPSEDVETATMAGGWTFAIPATSEQPDVAWEFMKAMLDISTLGQMQAQFGFLPTQDSFARELDEEFAGFWNRGGVDRWSAFQELAPNSYGRPSFPTWPEVGAAITDMVQSVQFENEDPATAAGSAQASVLTEVLGWPEGTTVSLVDDADGSCGQPDTDLLIGAVTPVQVGADANGNGSICTRVSLP